MALGIDDYRRLYARLAGFYDTGIRLYPLFGIRMAAYRRMAVASLQLRTGDTVVDLGCGTGLNFALLREAVGVSGRIIGVDATPEMLGQARRRAEANGWHNVELINADMAAYSFPEDTDAVLATLALSTSAQYDTVVARTAAALPPGARLADFELKWPQRWPRWLARLAAVANRPAGVTLDIVDRDPSRSIRRHLADFRYREVCLGAGFVCSGAAPARAS